MEKITRLCIDFGHGGNDPGATYKGRKEKDDVLKLGLAIVKEIRNHGVLVDLTRKDDIGVSLRERSDFEKKGNYDYFISIHRNAFKAEKASGVETFTYINQALKSKNLADKIQKNLVEVGFKDRKVKQANFHVLRETRSPAVLVEVGFIDNTKDNELFDAKFDEIVEAITKGILEQVGLKCMVNNDNIPDTDNKETYYRVMAGSYKDQTNAKRQVEKLKRAGFDAVIMPYKV